MPINLSNFLVDERGFMNMQRGGCYPMEMDYLEFRVWNLECITALNDDEYKWMVELCRRIDDNKISLMDEDSCAVFTAYKIYFDKNKNLCITNPP